MKKEALHMMKKGIFKVGEAGAKSASMYDWYEPKVPEKLQKKLQEKK